MFSQVLNHNRRQSDFIEEDCSRASTGSRLSTTTTDTRMSGNFNTKKIAGMFNDFLNPNVSSNSSSNDNCVDDIEDNLAANLSNINLDRLGKRQSCPERSNSVKSSKSGKRNLTDIHEENIQSVSLDMPEKENTAKNFQNHKNQEFVFTPKLSLSQMSTPISENLEQSGKDKSDYSVEKIVVEGNFYLNTSIKF